MVLTLLVRLFSRNRRRSIAILLAAAVAIVIAGGAVFAFTSHQPFTTGLYFAIVTATTVGYGDVTPPNPVSRVVAVVLMLTTIPMLASVFALVTGQTAANALRRILGMTTEFPDPPYRLVIGAHPVMAEVVQDLERAGSKVVLVADVDPARAPGRAHVVRGDPTQAAVIAACHPDRAELALVTGQSDSDVLVSTVLLRKHAPGLPITALVASGSVREALRELGVSQAISAEELIAHTLAKSIETPHAGQLLHQLVDSSQHSLAEIEADAATAGKRLSAVRDERDGLVLALVHDGQLNLGIDEDPVVSSGDHLLVVD